MSIAQIFFQPYLSTSSLSSKFRLVLNRFCFSLCSQKEKDIELTARIGKELLAHNQKLESTVAALEVEIKAANEKITQLTYDLHRKTELINVLTNDDSCSEASEYLGALGVF